MPLRDDQERKLVSWCSGNGVDARCPMCSKNDWTTGEIVQVELAAESEEAGDSEGTSMIQIICDHCKLIMLFAAQPILGENL